MRFNFNYMWRCFFKFLHNLQLLLSEGNLSRNLEIGLFYQRAFYSIRILGNVCNEKRLRKKEKR